MKTSPDMRSHSYAPVYELTREETIESVHYGSVAVVQSDGRLVAWCGDPYTVTYLRSTAKPIQAMPFIAAGGAAHYRLTDTEIALLCASHSGTDAHKRVVEEIQKKSGVSESELLCGTHPPYHAETAEEMRKRGELPTPNRHNCSGKHTGMVAFAKMQNIAVEGYVQPQHPVQEQILQVFALMTGLSPDEVATGIDGCSAPNFAVPLYNAAYAYARLCDPEHGSIPAAYQSACQRITSAMTSNPDMVGGPGQFDTQLMQVTRGKLLSKGGAEGYQGIGLKPGATGKDSPAMGIVIKISDGDLKSRARSAIALEVLRQLGAITPEELAELSDFGPALPIYNWRKLVVGQSRPCFELQRQP